MATGELTECPQWACFAAEDAGPLMAPAWFDSATIDSIYIYKAIQNVGP